MVLRCQNLNCRTEIQDRTKACPGCGAWFMEQSDVDDVKRVTAGLSAECESLKEIEAEVTKASDRLVRTGWREESAIADIERLMFQARQISDQIENLGHTLTRMHKAVLQKRY